MIDDIIECLDVEFELHHERSVEVSNSPYESNPFERQGSKLPPDRAIRTKLSPPPFAGAAVS